MKLKVATQVSGGFALIGVLLLVLGYASISSLNNVGKNFTDVSEVAMPALTGSANLKVAFLDMGRLSFEGYMEVEKESAQTKQAEFQQSQQVFSDTISQLKSAVNEHANLSSAVSQIESTYSEYASSTDRMFVNHLNAIQLNLLLADQSETIEFAADDASSVLMDFTDLDSVQTSTRVDEITNLAADLESSMLNVINNGSVFLSSENIQRAELRRQEVTLVVEKLQQQFNSLSSFGLGGEAEEYLDEIGVYLNDIVRLVNGDEGILTLKLTQLQNAAEANAALARSDEIIEQAVSQLTNLTGLAKSTAAGIEERATDSIDNGILISIIVLVVSISVGVFVSISTTKSITSPLSKINKFLKVASSGDLTQKLNNDSNNEFGELSQNCNQLTDSLKQLIKGINERAQQLADASTETSTINQESTCLIEEQKNEISQVAAATTQMHTTTELVSSCADNTLKEVKQADNEAEKVKQISNENKRTIQALAIEVDEAATVINQLHQDSEAISSILDVIRGVAEQTNLLALNAAIEAARAGEHGRGFAVVADEVRTLASRTQESAQEINSMIEALQAGAEQAVAVMTKGKEQTQVCVEQTENAGSALNLITDAVHRAYEVSKQIEQASSQQHTVSEQISRRLDSVVDIAEKTTEGARKTTSSSSEVSRLADELRDSIRRFTV